MSGDLELLAILKEVSRSFYISVRFLPARIRMTIALAYLLARASDTIADTNQLPATERIDVLQRFTESLSRPATEHQTDLAACLTKQWEGPEEMLLANIDRVFEGLSKIPASHRELVNEVLGKIIRGQTLDIERFELEPGAKALKDGAALEEYTYLVAGCVGEFWTKVCFLAWPRYARLPESEMLRTGKRFGQGLQLINILRDFPVDLQAGRCYLPVADPTAVGSDPRLARPEWELWHHRANGYLEEAWKYICAVRPLRVRFACAMPVLIGVRTLRLLGDTSTMVAGLKVSRHGVRWIMIWAAGIALFQCLEPVAHRKFFRRSTSPQER
jgi:farnesyl-diphosphate farnesyltransferase